MYYKKELGNTGEECAYNYLVETGYSILNKNYTSKVGEIDIICLDSSFKEPELIFVEVKTRYDNRCGNPAEAVDKRKKKHIIKTAQYYLFENKLENMNIRFDVIEVLPCHKNLYSINHIKNAFDYSDVY